MPAPASRNTPIAPRGKTTPEVSKRNKAAVLQVLKAFNTGNTDLVDDVTAERLVSYTPKPGLPADREGLKQQIMFFREQFSRLKFEAQEIMAEGDVVYFRWKMTGTHRAPFLGRPATGKRITHFGQEIVRLKSGKMVEHRDTFDMMNFLDKLGILDAKMLKRLEEIGLRPR
jgi:predicted ester cyclase